MERVWPDVTVGEEVLTHAIAELRKALGDDSRRPRYVETVHRSGYRLLKPVLQSHVSGSLAIAAPASIEDALYSTEARAGAQFDLDAYAACVRAFQLYDRGGRGNSLAAIALYASTLERHPKLVMAHVGLATALTFHGAYYDPREENFERARIHCTTALKLDAQSADAFAALGFLLALGAGDFDAAIEQFKTALRLQPEASATHYLLGRVCFAQARFGLAAAMMERAASLRPDNFHALVMGGKARLKIGEHGQARADFVRALARIELELGAEPGGYRAICGKAHCLWHLGREDQALDLIDCMTGHRDPMKYYTASLYARACETEAALNTLAESAEEGWRHGALLECDPDFDTLRDTRRFKRIARSVGADL